MADYILDVVNQTSKLDWAFPFQRTGAFPLDRSSLFSSLSDALAYASGVADDERKLGGTSYVGQPISVYDIDTNSVTLYIINPDRSLKEVGSTPIGDNLSVEIIDGKVQLKDFGIGYYAYSPAETDDTGVIIKEAGYSYVEGFKAGLEPRVRLEEENLVIAWYEPSGETIEDVSANLEALSQRVESVENNINTTEQNIKALQTQVDNKANASDVYTKDETDSKIKEEIDKLDHLKRTTVAGIESIDLTADDADRYIYMVPNAETGNYDEYMVIDGELEKVGDWSVDLTGYVTTEDLENKVDKDSNARLMTNAEGEKLAAIEENAQENYIKSVDTEFSVDEAGQLHLESISQSKVDGLSSTLKAQQTQIDNKVDSVAGSRLITFAEVTKLQNIKDLIQSVNAANFTVSEAGELNLNDIAISKIIGLQDALNDKVTTVYSEVDGEQVAWTLLSPEDQAKLNALVLGDDNNVEISGKVNASNVEGLGSWITANRDSVDGLLSALQEAKLESIQEGAEKNFISSVDTATFSVTNGHLELVNVEMNLVNGLQSTLGAKASQTSLTTLENTLNLRIDNIENNMAEIDARLTWQSV